MDRNCVFAIITTLLVLPQVKSFCSDPSCAVCNNGGNTCDVCENGFTLKNNMCSPCPKNCLKCADNDYCQSCSPGFWGYQCLDRCPENCDDTGCEMNLGNCHGCKTGWYGLTCKQDCHRCEVEQCDLHKCITGCKDGYFEDIYNNVSYCMSCVPFCKTCSNTTFCTQCNSGYYMYKYMVTAGIVSTFSSCSSAVPKCIDCTYEQNRVSCSNCEPGYVVNQENQCVTAVPCLHCQNGCDSDGRCLGECEPGWTGTRCDYQCIYSCETCLNQDACLSCKDGFYTQKCNVPCNPNCQSGNYPRCRFGDGYCSSGCNKGFWGDECGYICNNNCLDITTGSELCHRNGTCYYGCKSGYMGSDCSQVFSTSPSTFSSTHTLRASTVERSLISSTVKSILISTDKPTTLLTQTKTDVKATETNVQTVSDNRGALGPAIGGSIAGAFVLGVLAVVVVFYLRKRILQKQKDRTQSENMYYNVSMSTSHEERSQSGTDRHPDRKDMVLASASNQCEATLYEMLSERNKGNLYDRFLMCFA